MTYTNHPFGSPQPSRNQPSAPLSSSQAFANQFLSSPHPHSYYVHPPGQNPSVTGNYSAGGAYHNLLLATYLPEISIFGGRSAHQLSSIGSQGGAEMNSEETCIQLGNMIVGSNGASARCVEAIGKELAGGTVAKDFQACVDINAHNGVIDMINDGSMSVVRFVCATRRKVEGQQRRCPGAAQIIGSHN